MKFDVGEIVVTPAASAALEANGLTLDDLLARHQAGDWGSVSAQVREVNERGLLEQFNLQSTYSLTDGRRLMVVTNRERTTTTIHLDAPIGAGFMPTKNAPDISHTCPGCQVTFLGPANETWCPRCHGRTKTVTVELGPDQHQHLETLAVDRNTTPEEIMRVALTSLMGRTKTKQLTGAEQKQAEQLRPSRRAPR